MRRRKLLVPMAALGLAAAVGWLSTTPELKAADHIDFPKEMLGSDVEPAVDITDLMAWTPAPGRLALALDVHMGATDQSRFSDAVAYRFRIRTAKRSTENEGPLVVAGDESTETTISCSTEGGGLKMRCAIDGVKGSDKVVGLGEIAPAPKSGLRVFAGLRADPFFLDVVGAKTTLGSALTGTPTLTMPGEDPKNFSNGLNVMSIVLEFDAKSVLGISYSNPDTRLVAVSAETARKAQ